jgi:CTP synthase (UTP-ammonia lyase)
MPQRNGDPEEMRQKLALFCNVRKEDIIQNLTLPTLYEAPLMLEKEGLAERYATIWRWKTGP